MSLPMTVDQADIQVNSGALVADVSAENEVRIDLNKSNYLQQSVTFHDYTIDKSEVMIYPTLSVR